MVFPEGFRNNEDTAGDNFFQSGPGISHQAKAEFKNFKNLLEENGIIVKTFTPPDETTPDAVFPNNWFSTTPDGRLFFYPLKAKNRRVERRTEICNWLRNNYPHITDLTYLEEENKFLESTGSMVIDHQNKRVYMSRSARSNEDLLTMWCNETGYSPVLFSSYDTEGRPVYHTNVVLTLADGFAVLCAEAVRNSKERESLIKSITESKRNIVYISIDQMNHFCGNCLALQNGKSQLLVMSETARNNFTEIQLDEINSHCHIISSNVSSIENAGGGSVRCMIAELF